MSWLCDCKVGESYRKPDATTLTSNFALEDKFSSFSTRVWLMGDGTGDAAASIKNQVNVSGTDARNTELDLYDGNSYLYLWNILAYAHNAPTYFYLVSILLHLFLFYMPPDSCFLFF